MPKGNLASKSIELILCGLTLTFALPMSIALFEQQASLSRDEIDDDLKETIVKKDIMQDGKLFPKKTSEESTSSSDGESDKPQYVQRFYFNKGL